MGDSLPQSMIQKGLKLEDVFFEVQHNENLGLSHKGQLRLFHMAMHSNKFYSDDLQAVLSRNLARYVFSRAKLEDFRQNDELESAVAQAMRIMRENGDAHAEGTGNALSEIMVYAFLEEILHAPKIMSRVELYNDMSRFKSECKGIHLVSPENSGALRYELVFGASNIVGKLKNAIDEVFVAIEKMENHSSREITMVKKTAMDLMVKGKTADALKEIIIPQPGKPTNYDIAYGVFLGYSLGLRDKDTGEDFATRAEHKMAYDLHHLAPYIAEKIKKKGWDSSHSFYFYLVPFNDADQEKYDIMDNILKGGVIL